MTDHDQPPGAAKRQRIAKLMARAGLCSRRDAEAWIVDGRVSVNGALISSPALDVSDDDAILVDGVPLPAAEKTRLFLFHKPRGLVTSDHDPEGRATVADFLHEHWPEGPRVVTIGRLDINTEGLLLLTNDGGLARLLELPQTGWARRYRVRAKGEANPAALEALSAGVTIEGIDYAGIEAKLDRVQGANCWLTMGLREGKNREVKRVLEHVGLEVNRLIRLSFGPFQLLDLPEGAVEEVRTRVLRDQLGPTLAAQAGVDFGEPVTVTPVADRAPGETRGRDKRRPERDISAARDRAPARTARPPGDRPTRPRREDLDAPPPQRDRPVAGTRKHVSTLRAAETETTRKGPRKRIERTDTVDRRDRTIKVERLVSTRPASDRPLSRRPRAAEPRDASPRGRTDERRSATRSPDKRGGSDRSERRPDSSARHRDDRPPRGERPESRDDRLDARRSEGTAPRRHASPSAIGKRERISRSGAAPERTRDSGSREERGDRRRPDESRPMRAHRGERAQVPRPGAERRAPRTEHSDRRDDRDARQSRRPDAERPARPRSASERHEGRRSDEVPKAPRSAGRPMGAASRKPSNRKPSGGSPSKPRGPGGPPRGKPPRGASKPKR